MEQHIKNLEKIFNKKWVVKSYEISDQIIMATDVQDGDYTTFLPDNKVVSVSRGLTEKSNWSYSPENNALILTSDMDDIQTEMIIRTVEEESFVWETTNPEGVKLKVMMKKN